MSVSITYHCGGCDAVETVTGLRQRWEVVLPAAIHVGGVAFDRCRVIIPTIESAAPEGWVPFDPHTGVCYCPICWAEIESTLVASARRER